MIKVKKTKSTNIFRALKLADLFSLLNLSSGLAAILLATTQKLTIACIFILIALLFDFFDGKIARSMNQTTALGKELDSLADLISFGVAPIIISFHATTYSAQILIPVIITYVLFIWAGALRLARFNVSPKKYYEGMPITINALIVAVVYFTGFVNILPVFLLLSAILMVSTFKIKKIF